MDMQNAGAGVKAIHRLLDQVVPTDGNVLGIAPKPGRASRGRVMIKRFWFSGSNESSVKYINDPILQLTSCSDTLAASLTSIRLWANTDQTAQCFRRQCLEARRWGLFCRR